MKKVLMCAVLSEGFYKSRRELINRFVSKGYQVVLIAPDSDEGIKKTFAGMPVTYYQIPFERSGLNPLTDIRFLDRLREVIRREKPDRTYAFSGAKAAIYTTIAASRENVPEIFAMINGLGSIFRGRGVRSDLIRIVMSALFKSALSKATGVLFQNTDDMGVFVSKKLVSPEKCGIVNGSGVDLELFPRSRIPDQDRFLFLARLLRDKGINEFIRAAEIVKRRCPEVIFDVVGPYDPDNPTSLHPDEMERWMARGVVNYHGGQEDVFPYYEACSVFVLPAYHEGTPRTNLEAMAVGRPVITTDAPGCRDTVIDGETGFLVPVKDAEALAEKMIFFIENREQLAVFGAKARAFAEEKYDVHKVNDSILDFMDKACGRERVAAR